MIFKDRNVSLWKYIILILLILLAGLALFPGSYSTDSWSMYQAAASGSYDDWFSPLLSWIWRVLIGLTGRYYMIYIWQMMLYAIFIGLLTTIVTHKTIPFWTGLFFGILFLFIPQYVMRDSHLAISWGIAGGVLMAASKAESAKNRKKTVAGLLAMVLLIYGLFIRINAILAIVPLIYACLEILLPALSRLSWPGPSGPSAGLILKRSLLALVLAALFFWGNNIFNYKILYAGRLYPEYKLKLLDVAGISAVSGQNFIPPCIASYPDFRYKKLMDLYTPASLESIYWVREGSRYMIPRPDAGLNDCTDRSWRKAIQAHPCLYVKNRMQGFLYYLRIKKRFAPSEYWNYAIWIEPDNPLHLKQTHNFVSNGLGSIYTALGNTPFFEPWLWLLLNILMFGYFSWQYHKDRWAPHKIMALIQSSAVIYTLSQFFIYQSDRDFRYHYWNLLAFMMAIVFLSDRRIIPGPLKTKSGLIHDP